MMTIRCRRGRRLWPNAALAMAAILTLCSLGLGQSTSRPATGDAPTIVRVGLFVLDVDAIDSAQQSFAANVYIEAQWMDPRLAHDGGVIKRPLIDVWHPRLQLLNQQKLFATFPEAVEVMGNGEVIYRQRYWGNFSQPLRLHKFPFDHQVLTIQVVPGGYTPSEVEIAPLSEASGRMSGISPSFSVADWAVVKWDVQASPIVLIPGREGMSSLLFSLEMTRESAYYIIKVILPLCMIVAMSWVSFWIDPDEVSVNVSVAITSVLTIVAYRFSIGETLPKIAYLTRMDAFTLAAMFLVFLAVIQVVVNSMLVKRGHKQIAQRFDRAARLAYPAGFACMLVWTLFLM